MNENCRICKQKINAPSDDFDHSLNRAPVDGGLCLACWIAGVELQTFLFRSGRIVPMGNWTEGYLREMIENPRKHL